MAEEGGKPPDRGGGPDVPPPPQPRPADFAGEELVDFATAICPRIESQEALLSLCMGFGAAISDIAQLQNLGQSPGRLEELCAAFREQLLRTAAEWRRIDGQAHGAR